MRPEGSVGRVPFVPPDRIPTTDSTVGRPPRASSPETWCARAARCHAVSFFRRFGGRSPLVSRPSPASSPPAPARLETDSSTPRERPRRSRPGRWSKPRCLGGGPTDSSPAVSPEPRCVRPGLALGVLTALRPDPTSDWTSTAVVTPRRWLAHTGGYPTMGSGYPTVASCPRRGVTEEVTGEPSRSGIGAIRTVESRVAGVLPYS